MRSRTAFLLAALGLSVAIFVLSQFISSGTFLRKAAAAPNPDFQRAQKLLQQAGALRANHDWDKAKKCYEDALKGFQAAGTQRFVVAAQAMVDLCDAMPTLNLAKMKDGTYQGSQMGYVADVTVEVTVKGGKIAGMKIVSTKESRALKSLETVPQEIVTRKTPSVDAFTGATITSCAVMGATVKALQQAQPDEKPRASKPATE